MLKKLTAVSALALMLAACGSDKDEAVDKKVEEVEDVAPEEEEPVEDEATEEEAELVEVTVPVTFATDFSDGVTGEEEVFQEVTENEDGSMTFVMYDEVREEFASSFGEQVDKEIQNIVDTYPLYQEIEYTTDLTEFDVKVNYEEALAEDDITGLITLVMLSGNYVAFSGNNPEETELTFNILDFESGEVMETLVYPTDFAQ